MKTNSANGRETGNRRAGGGLSNARSVALAPKSEVEKGPSIPSKWRWHYRTLLRLRDELTQDARNKLHDAEAPIEPHGTHMADSASDEFDHDLALTLLAREENSLIEINDAIGRILDGKYGVCAVTGRRIPSRRLRALPWCRYTREVEAQLEKTGAVTKLGSIRGANLPVR